jgi:hypothetical protein
MDTTFGLITEGPTDQVILRYLLAKFFSNPNIDTRPVQPNTDSTDTLAHLGGWGRALAYCKSAGMIIALQAYDFMIIQVDTDRCEDFGVMKREGCHDVSNEEIAEKTKAVIIEHIGNDLYRQYHQKIVFAISHESIECWLLPLYFNDNNRKKTFNCCEKLNQELIKDGFTLDCNNKKEKYYYRICKKIRNKEHVESIAAHNHSFSLFIQRLASL